MLLVLYQVQIIMGIFISYVIDLGTHTINGPASWRIPVGLQIAWGFILLSGIFFLPESREYSFPRRPLRGVVGRRLMRRVV